MAAPRSGGPRRRVAVGGGVVLTRPCLSHSRDLRATQTGGCGRGLTERPCLAAGAAEAEAAAGAVSEAGAAREEVAAVNVLITVLARFFVVGADLV